MRKYIGIFLLGAVLVSHNGYASGPGAGAAVPGTESEVSSEAPSVEAKKPIAENEKIAIWLFSTPDYKPNGMFMYDAIAWLKKVFKSTPVEERDAVLQLAKSFYDGIDKSVQNKISIRLLAEAILAIPADKRETVVSLANIIVSSLQHEYLFDGKYIYSYLKGLSKLSDEQRRMFFEDVLSKVFAVCPSSHRADTLDYYFTMPGMYNIRIEQFEKEIANKLNSKPWGD